MEEFFKGFRIFDYAAVVKHLVPKACIQQVQNGVFGASDVEVGVSPILFRFGTYGGGVVVRIAVAQVIPA